MRDLRRFLHDLDALGCWIERFRVGQHINLLQVFVHHVLGVARIESQVFRHVDERVPLIVGHAVGIEPAQSQHAQEIIARID